jgi:type II secretory pathway component PulM
MLERAMIERLVSIVASRNARERGLLAGLFVFVLPAAAVFLLVLPSMESVENAKKAVLDARYENAWVAQQNSEFGGFAAQGPSRDVVDPLGLAGLEELLRNAGLHQSVGRMSNRDAGAIEITFEQVEFAQLARWVSANQSSWGYDIQTFRIDAHIRAGFVDAEFHLEPMK